MIQCRGSVVGVKTWAGPCGLLAFLLPVTSVHAQVNEAAHAAQASDDSEIVVTARRRAEDVQKVPIALTLQSGQALIDKNVQTVANLTQSTPSLFTLPATGSPAAVLVAIRGMIQSDSLNTLDPSVGVYIDDVYIARSYGALVDLVDIDRVEILKGPQGTLYGRNTTGGAIRVVTAKPSPSEPPTGFLRAGIGNFNSRLVQGAVNLPLVEDKLALRYAASYRERDGYTRSVVVLQPSLTPLKTIRSDDALSIVQRLQALANITDSFRLSGSVDYFWSDTNGQLNVDRRGDIHSTVPRPSPERERNSHAGLTPFAPRAAAEAFGLSVTADVDLSEEVGAKLVLSDRVTEVWTDGNNGGGATDGSGVNFFSFNNQRSRQRTAELQVSNQSEDSRLDWIFGLYYFQEKGRDHTDLNTFTPVAIVEPNHTIYEGYVVNTSYSAFAHLQYGITDALKVEAGLRWSHDKKELRGRNRVNGACVYIPGQPNVVNDGVQCLFNPKPSFSYPSWNVGLSYEMSSRLFVYAKSSRASRSGGNQIRGSNYQTLLPFDEETATDIEVGLKGSLFDRRLTFSANYFHTFYDDVQVSVTVVTPAGAASMIQNLGKANVDGAEFEGVLRLTDNLRLEGTLSWVDFKYKLADRFVRDKTPRFQTSAALAFDQPTNFGKFRARVDFFHRSKFILHPDAANLLTWGDLDESPALSLVSGRLGVEFNNGFDIAVWGKNLADKRYISNGTIAGAFIPVQYGEPRTFGIELGYRF